MAEETPGHQLLARAKRVLILGDSITASGQYVAYFDAWLATELKDKAPRLIDCGLPSETVSGLSEDGHAGGQFPRPDLAERLDRVLRAVQPDLVIACYGINCGIYSPFDESRFEKYQAGMKQLKVAVEKSGAKFVVMTPPFYDDQRSPRPFSYNAVLDRYSEWLIGQRKEGWTVIDLHQPMTKFVTDRRASDPQFTVQPDGVHPNDAGHWFIAQQMIRWAGDETAAGADSPKSMLRAKQVPDALLPLVQQRMTVLRDAYVAAAGHKRPGVAQGLPVAEADAKANELSAKIEAIVGSSK
jgi:lysophospholipase L1-like esterase